MRTPIPATNSPCLVLTTSPGDPVFFKFGHIAVLVHDSRTGRDEVYNWGTFSFEEDGLVWKFLKGRLTYWLSVQGMRSTLRQYEYENRWLVSQELNLTAAQKLKLVGNVRENAQPVNAKYRYHYYRDNCSTRVRDVIDNATGGALHAVSNAPSSLTYRGETSRLVADTWWAYVFLNLAMGSFIDQPITQWDDMFVPERVREQLRAATNQMADGQTVPLVRSERELITVDRVGPPNAPPKRLLVLTVVGLLVGALLGWLGFRLISTPAGVRTSLGRRLAFTLPMAVLAAFAGFFGSMFLFFWTCTDHEVAWHNENLLQVSPAAFALCVLAFGLLRDRGWPAPAIVGWRTRLQQCRGLDCS